MWLPPYQIVFLLSMLGKVPQQAFISDYRHLIEQWAKEEHNRISDHGIEWIDFDASRQETRKYCESSDDVRHRLKECKLGVHQKDFRVDNIVEPKKSEKLLHQSSHINNGNETDEVSIKKRIDYLDHFTVSTNWGLKFFQGQEIKVPIDERINFTDWGIDVNLRLNFDWDISSENEKHNESKIVDIKEKFILSPFSKAEIKLVMQEINYDINFSANVIIDGFFVVKCGWWDRMYIYEAGEVIHNITNNPFWYSEYLRQLAKPYSYSNWQEGDYYYQVANYENIGRVKGTYGYNVSSEKRTIPLDHAGPTPGDSDDHWKININYPIGIGGIVLLAAGGRWGLGIF